MIQTDRQRNCNLDLLRILACLAVIGLHTSDKDIFIVNTIVYYFCGFAVPCFFMASGYILLQRGNINYSYVYKKYKQILSVVLLWGVVGGITSVIYGLYNNYDGIFLIIKFIKFVFCGLLQKGFYWQLWFFGALLIVYAILPFIVSLKIKHKIIIWTICFIIGEVMQLISLEMGVPVQKSIIQTFRVWTWLQYFILGGFIPLINEKIFSNILIYLHGLLLIVWTIIVLAYQCYIGSHVLNNNIIGVQYAEFFYDSILDIIWLTGIFTFFIRIKLSCTMNKYISMFAPLSMGIYIIHPMILNIVKHFLIIDAPIKALYLFLLVMVITSAVVAMLYYRNTRLGKLIKL